MSQFGSASDSGGGGLNVQQITADVGVVIPVANNVNAFGAHGINTLGVGDTLTIAIDNEITLGDLAALPANSNALTCSTGDIEIISGSLKMPETASVNIGVIKWGGLPFINAAGPFNGAVGPANCFMGGSAGNPSVIPTGSFNVGIGRQALLNLSSGTGNVCIGGLLPGVSIQDGSDNVSIGTNSMGQNVSSGENVCIGSRSLEQATAPQGNICIGHWSGRDFLSNESNNIVIGNLGVLGDNDTIRIGTTGIQSLCFISGIDGVDVGSVATVVTESGDQLGTAVITAGSGITVTPGINTITIAGSSSLSYTNVNTSPYVVLSSDQYLGVDCSAGPIQLNFPDAPATGRVFTVKDFGGFAAVNNITITSVGGAIGFDGGLTYVMNTAYQSVQLLFDGTNYQIY